MKQVNLTQELVRRLFDYESGRLIWKYRPDSDFKSKSIAKRWNAKYAGHPSGKRVAALEGLIGKGMSGKEAE